jgi:hypothetical protein
MAEMMLRITGGPHPQVHVFPSGAHKHEPQK